MAGRPALADELINAMKEPLWPTLKRFLIHAVLGAAAALAGWYSNIGLFYGVTAVFIAYEENEDTHINDSAYHDYRGYIGGVILAAVYIFLRNHFTPYHFRLL